LPDNGYRKVMLHGSEFASMLIVHS
jgi:hypothetical protein